MMRDFFLAALMAAALHLPRAGLAQAPTPKPAAKKISITDKDIKKAQGDAPEGGGAKKVSGREAMAWLDERRLANTSVKEIVEEAKKRGVTVGQVVDWLKGLVQECRGKLSDAEAQFKKLKPQIEEAHGAKSPEMKKLRDEYDARCGKLRLAIRMADDAIRQFAPRPGDGEPLAEGEDPMALFDLKRLTGMSGERIAAEFQSRKLTTGQILEGMRRVRTQAAEQLETLDRSFKRNMPEMEKNYGAGSREARQLAEAHELTSSKLKKLIADADALLGRYGAAGTPKSGAAQGAP